MRLAFFVSGGGGFSKSVYRAEDQIEPGKLNLIIADRDCSAYQFFLNETKIPTYLVDYKSYESREEAEFAILNLCNKHSIELICLTFDRILSSHFLDQLNIPIINLHLALLPMFKGMDSMKRAFESKVAFHGSTIHFVTEELDDGPIISQFVCPRNKGERKEEFFDRHFKFTSILLIQTLSRICNSFKNKESVTLMKTNFGQAFFYLPTSSDAGG